MRAQHPLSKRPHHDKRKGASRKTSALPLSKVISELSRKPSGLDLSLRRKFTSPRTCRLVPPSSIGTIKERTAHGTTVFIAPRINMRRSRASFLMLHGCTQSPEDFAGGGTPRMNEPRRSGTRSSSSIRGQSARAQRVASAGTGSAPGDQGRSEGRARAARRIGGRHCLRTRGAPVAHLRGPALSAGGAMAAILSLTHRRVFAAVGVHSGLAPALGAGHDLGVQRHGAARRAPGAKALSVPAIIFHGSADKTVAPVNCGPSRRSGPTGRDMVRRDEGPSLRCSQRARRDRTSGRGLADRRRRSYLVGGACRWQP